MFIRHRHGGGECEQIPVWIRSCLPARFLSEASGAVALEDGAVLFDLAQAKYSISGEHNKCLLHLWSAERNTVRRVLEAEVKSGTLRLAVQSLGQARPTKLEICRERDRRSPTAKRAARTAYEAKLARDRAAFSGIHSHPSDIQRGPGEVVWTGVRAWDVVSGTERICRVGSECDRAQSSIDASLTFGILWLDVCRENPHFWQHRPEVGHPRNVLVEGLILFVPAGCSALVRERMANLNRGAAKWRLFEFDERHDSVIEIDCSDRGNIATRLVHATNETAALERFSESIDRVQGILPNCEVAVLSPAEIAFRWRGLEFARARMGAEEVTFRSRQEIVFGVGAEERVLEDRNWALFVQLTTALRDVRHPYGPRQNRLFRMHPERWLESLVRADVSVIDERLEIESVYSQVPAFSAADRAMIDVLTLTRDARPAVVELKADEDILCHYKG